MEEELMAMRPTLEATRQAMQADEANWRIPFFDYVDEIRRSRDTSLFATPFAAEHPRFDPLLASTIEYLCDELKLETPEWIWDLPSCKDPWLVAGVENLKAMAIALSPAHFRRRKIFVLDNFLSRV